MIDCIIVSYKICYWMQWEGDKRRRSVRCRFVTDCDINYILINISNMSKDQHDEFLRYGQGILLKGFVQESEDPGFLTAKGFADTTAKYQTYKDILYFKNYRNTIFQIIPASNFEINDELRKFQEMSSQRNANILILEAKAKSQQEQFRLNVKSKQQKQVCFGDTVIFQHVDSDTFLSGTIRPANGNNGAFTVEVTKNLSDILVFKVLPFRSYENIGMPIPFDSPIKLLNVFNNGLLTYQKVGTNKQIKKIDLDKKPIQADPSYVLPVKTNSSESITYECVTHFVDLSKQDAENPMPWKFQLHMQEVENDSLIQHDIIYFQHTENGGILSTQGKDIILKEMKNEGTEQLPFYECLWEVQKHQREQTEHAYILRHLMSGMTLGIQKNADGHPTKAQLFDISEGVAEGNLGWLELKLAKKQKADINSDAKINICFGQWCLDKQKQEQIKELEQEDQRSTDYISISKLNKLAVNELEYEVKKVKFTTQISKNCFIIKQIKDDLKKQVLFALSFHAKIIDLRQDLKWGHQESSQKISYIRMMQVTEKIKQIKDFLKNCTKEESQLQHIRPIFKRQMICKDLGISELLFELLFYMRHNLAGKYIKKELEDKTIEYAPYIFDKKPNELEKFIQLYNSIYEVIYELVRDNLLFKIYVSKWINFVIQDVIVENEKSHLALLKELWKDNQFLVKNFVDETLVGKLSNKMLTQKDTYQFVQIKYLSIFRLFCIVGDNINTSNQIAILNRFIKELKKTQLSSFYQITLTKQNEDILAEAAIDKNILKKRRFKDYFKICKEQYETAWHYFVEYLNLVADMTKGRNKLVQDYMKSMFTLQILTQLYLREELEEAEAPIIRVLHNLFIESEFYYPIQKKKRISDYNLLKTEEIDVMRTSNELSAPWKAASLMKVLDGTCKKLSEFGPIEPSSNRKIMIKNDNLLQILSFIWQTLNLGFWQKKEQVKEILNHIERILEPHPNIASAETPDGLIKNYQKASVQCKQNILVMKCKQECMNIIQLILDYDLDLTVRYNCKFFQVFQMPVKKRQLISDDNSRLLEARIDNELAIKFIHELPKESITLVEPSIISKMIELSKYNNPKLTSGSISIMERVLLKKKKAIQFFCQQIFVSGEERLALKKFIQQKKDKFYIMEDQTLVKMIRLEDQVDNYVSIFKQDPIDTGIMQDIYMMSEIIKNQSSASRINDVKTLQGSGVNSKLGEKRLINFTDERTSSNTMKQNVMDAQNIHVKVLYFVLNCTEIPPEQSYSLKLLHLSYKFLVSLIWNYQNIKPTLISYIPFIQHHLRKNVGCIDFLKQMYDNNKTMLFNQVSVVKLIKQICFSINSQPQDSCYKSKLLDFFRFLIYCNGKSLKNNQITILKIMQDDSFTTIILNIDRKMIEQLVADYKSRLQVFENPDSPAAERSALKMNPKLLYLITYCQILTSLIDDRNSVNMGKLKKRFPFDRLVDWIKACDICWPLKRNIRAFLNRLYYFQPEIQIYMKSIVGEELDNIINDLNKYILIKCKSNIGQIEGYIFHDPVRFSYLESYLYLNLEENLFTLYQLATDKNIEKQMKTILHPLDKTGNNGPVNFIRICERLGFIKNYFAERKNVYTNSFIKFLLNKFEKIIVQFDDDIYMPGMSLPSDQPRAPMKSEKQVARKALLNKIMRGDIATFYVQVTGQYDDRFPLVYRVPDKITNPKDDKKPNQNKLLKKLRQILKKEKAQFKNTDEQVDYKLNRLVTAIKLSPEANDLLSKSYNENLKQFSSDPKTFEYISIIIDMNSRNNKALPVKEKRFFLNFITGIVQQNNHTQLKQPKSIDLWQTDDWIDSKPNIGNIQNRLKGCKLGTFITQLLKENIWQNVQFADSILLCGIAYLFGGNTNTQTNMIETIKQDAENKVMRNLDTLISKLGEFIVKNIQESSGKVIDEKDTFSITTIDNYDFYDIPQRYVHRKNVFQPETTDEQIYTKTCIRTYKRAFKFLQLLCQNNNIDGKNFIRNQNNEIKNYDFIGIAAKQIRNIFLFLNTQICPVSMFLLDFILQTTQIPVKLNQQALMNLTFFEDVCTLQNVFYNKPQVISQKGFDGKEDLIDGIFFKAIQIILSNFEGNDIKTFQALDGKLQPKFLVNILTKKLADMGVSTKEDAIAYVDRIKSYKYDDNMLAILNIIIIFMKMKEKLGQNGRLYSMYDKERSKKSALYDYLQKCLIQIQIMNGGVQTIFFPKYPVFSSLTGSLRDSVMNSVSRSTHRDKIVSLLGYTSAIKTKIQSSYTLLKEHNISQQQLNDAFKISAVMSIVLCFYMMMFYNVIINYGQADFESSRIIGLGRFALSLVQVSMSMVYGYYWLRFKNWQHPERKNKEIPKPVIAEQNPDVVENKYVKFIKTKLILLANKLKLSQLTFFVLYTLRGGQTTQPLYISPEFWRVFLYVTVSFVGTFFYPPLYFIHILDIFCYNPQIGNIFKAIGLNIFQLFYVSLMGVFFSFVFCTVTFSNYQKNVYTGEEAESEMCSSMLQCILQLYVSGAIGETMQGFEPIRFTYDTIYGIFFGILFSNIISGIMLDAFASLRDLTNELQHDKENFCYICNYSRQTLQKKRIQFKTHINGQHFLWNYVFYIYYLDNKNSSDYSGLQYLITTQYNKPDQEMQIFWVPVNEQEPFDSKAKLQEIDAEVDKKAEFFETSNTEIEQSIKEFQALIAG